MRKLTKRIRYKISEETAVLYCQKANSDKWEPAFNCHIRTIDYIKEHGFKAALHLLRVYR